MARVFVLLLFVTSGLFASANADDLVRCVLITDPHIQTFHPNNVWPPPYKDCLEPGPLVVVRNDLFTLTVEVDNYWMVELLFVFRSQPNLPAFCTISSYNWVLSVDPGCASGNVSALILDYGYVVSLSVLYHLANISVVVTKDNGWGTRHYNLEVFMPSQAAAMSQGVCNQPGCTAVGRRRRVAPSRRSVRSATVSLSNDTARQVCDAYIDTYLGKVPRSASQRDIHYNATIANARQMCVFDVTANNASVAPGILHMLMIEEATTGILDFAAIPAAFQNHVADGLDAIIETVNETSPSVDQFLSNGTTQILTSGTSPISTTTTGSTSGMPSTSSTASTTDVPSTTSVGSTTGTQTTTGSTTSVSSITTAGSTTGVQSTISTTSATGVSNTTSTGSTISGQSTIGSTSGVSSPSTTTTRSTGSTTTVVSTLSSPSVASTQEPIYSNVRQFEAHTGLMFVSFFLLLQ